MVALIDGNRNISRSIREWLSTSLQAGFDEVALGLQRRHDSWAVDFETVEVGQANEWLGCTLEKQRAVIQAELEELRQRLLTALESQSFLEETRQAQWGSECTITDLTGEDNENPAVATMPERLPVPWATSNMNNQMPKSPRIEVRPKSGVSRPNTTPAAPTEGLWGSAKRARTPIGGAPELPPLPPAMVEREISSMMDEQLPGMVAKDFAGDADELKVSGRLDGPVSSPRLASKNSSCASNRLTALTAATTASTPQVTVSGKAVLQRSRSLRDLPFVVNNKANRISKWISKLCGKRKRRRRSSRNEGDDTMVSSEGESDQDGGAWGSQETDDAEYGYCWLLEDIVAHRWFETTFAALILINSVIMALQVQYRGIQRGYDIEYHSEPVPAVQVWPYAIETFHVMEWCFACLFSFELIMKFAAQRTRFWKDRWNLLDSVTVAFWFVDSLGNTVLPFPPMLLRLARLVRLLRLLRLVRKIQTFDSLYIMTASIRGSISALLWSTVLLCVVQMAIAFWLNEMVKTQILDENEPVALRHEVYQYYGTFSRAVVTMFELTLANWIDAARVLTENVSEWYTIFVLSHQLIIGFAMVSVIRGVFMHETFKVAQTDDNIMVAERERAIKLHTKKMNMLLAKADQNFDGFVDRDEFADILKEQSVRTWLAAMGLDVQDADTVFMLVDEEDAGQITPEQLVEGVDKLKGNARSFEVLQLMRDVTKAKESIQKLVTTMESKTLSARLSEKLGGCTHDRDSCKYSRLRDSCEGGIENDETRTSTKAEMLPDVYVQEPDQQGMPSWGSLYSSEDDRVSPDSRAGVGKVESMVSSIGSIRSHLQVKGQMESKSFLSRRNRLHRMVTSPAFDITFTALILLNSLIMAAESQYNGIDLGYQIGYRTVNEPAIQIVPWAPGFFEACEWLFGILFTVELVLKLVALRCDFFREGWNWMDSVIVASWFVGRLGAAHLPLDPMLLRLARLVRLLRLLRLVKAIKGFDSLYLMITALKSSCAALMWSSVLLFVVQMMLAMFLNEMLEAYICNLENTDEKRHQVYEYFGTFSRAMLSMFEITLANWAPVCRLLTENVSEWYVVFCLVHKITIGFAVVLVITGVFMQQTFKVAATDDTIMTMQQTRATEVHRRKMNLLFHAADEDGNGMLDFEEFKKIVNEKAVKTWLAAMGLRIDDVSTIFQFVAGDKSEGITADALVSGVAKLKGQARSLDLHVLMRDHKRLMSKVDEMAKRLAQDGVDSHTDADGVDMMRTAD